LEVLILTLDQKFRTIIKTFDLVPKKTFNLVPKLTETFDLVPFDLVPFDLVIKSQVNV
jgi:hypothetical protein